MKFYDVKNILEILFANGKYELDNRIEKVPAKINSPYYGYQNAISEWYMIKRWSYHKEVVNFLCSLKWLNVRTDAINEIIKKNSINKDDECMLPKEEFDKLNSWFSSVKNKYDTMKPIINEISYAGYDENDLSFELHENISLLDLQKLLENIKKFGNNLAKLFNLEENSILKFKHFDIGSNDLIIEILADSLSGVISSVVILCIKKIWNKFKELFIKKAEAENSKFENNIDNERYKILLEYAKETNFGEQEISKKLKKRLNDKYIDEIYQNVKQTRISINSKYKKDFTDNDKKLIEKLYSIYEEVNSISKVSLIKSYHKLKGINQNNVLESNELLNIEIKYLNQKYDEAINKLQKKENSPKQIDNNNKK